MIKKFRTVEKNENNIVVAYKNLTEREVDSAKKLNLSKDKYARMLFLNELLERVTGDPLKDYKVTAYPKYIKRGLELYGINIKLIDLKKGKNYVEAVGQWIVMIPEEKVKELPKEDLDNFFTYVEGEELERLIDEVEGPEYVKTEKDDDYDDYSFGKDEEKGEDEDTAMMFDIDLDEIDDDYETGESDYDWSGDEGLPETTNTSFLIGKPVK